MAFRKKKSRGSRGGGGVASGKFNSIIATVFGCVMMMMCLIGFNIVIGQIDTAYTAAGSYTEQVGVQDIMGIFPLLIFVVMMGVSVAALGYGGYTGYKSGSAGDVMGMIMGVINGVISTIIAFIMFGIINTSLHASYVVANATTNVANFAGVLDIMGIWGIVILVTLAGSAIASFAGVGVGAFKKIKGV